MIGVVPARVRDAQIERYSWEVVTLTPHTAGLVLATASRHTWAVIEVFAVVCFVAMGVAYPIAQRHGASNYRLGKIRSSFVGLSVMMVLVALHYLAAR